MNGRVLLLVVVTGFFMAAWDGDQAAMEAALARRAQQRATSVATVQEPAQPAQQASQPRVPQIKLTSSSKDVPTQQATVSTTKTISVNTEVPLPPGVTVGHYQAVSQSGVTLRITVTEEQATGQSARDFYVADSGTGDRWYLVRISD